MIHYVLGFAFSKPLDELLLIRKNKPASQKDRFNGIGGKIEPGESAAEAMAREFAEETGISDTFDKWKPLCEFSDGNNYHVTVFTSVLDIDEHQSPTDEEVVKMSPGDLLLHARAGRVMDNIVWMVGLALDNYNQYSQNIKLL